MHGMCEGFVEAVVLVCVQLIRLNTFRLFHAGACALPAAQRRALRGHEFAAAVATARRTAVATRAAAARGAPPTVGRRGDGGGPHLRHELGAHGGGR
jgi:hypothetical protein